MDHTKLQQSVAQSWQETIIPALNNYIAIPCLSPAFDPDWASAGHLNRAAALMSDWARTQLADFSAATIEIVQLPQRTPVLLIDIPGDVNTTVLIYGHLDKQPEMDGWTNGRSAWTPMLECDRLYGRGGADDGYAVFAAIAAVRALHSQNLQRPRCTILIEASEESGSPDLAAYVTHLLPKLSCASLVIALDGMCGNYDQLWTTTSLRGQIAGTLEVRTLESSVHSGDASGVVPCCFRIARDLLSRLEDPTSGRIAPDFHVEIPQARQQEAFTAAAELGSSLHYSLPGVAGLRAMNDEPAELVLNRSWRPQLTVTGLDGLPAVVQAAAVMQPIMRFKLSLRLPPTLDADLASQRLRKLLEDSPPYASKVSFAIEMVSPGWNAPATESWLQASLDRASQSVFGRCSAAVGGGGGIPFLAMLGDHLPHAQFIVTGVLGPLSNAHGPNEFLHLPTARKLTHALALLLHDAARARE